LFKQREDTMQVNGGERFPPIPRFLPSHPPVRSLIVILFLSPPPPRTERSRGCWGNCPQSLDQAKGPGFIRGWLQPTSLHENANVSVLVENENGRTFRHTKENQLHFRKTILSTRQPGPIVEKRESTRPGDRAKTGGRRSHGYLLVQDSSGRHSSPFPPSAENLRPFRARRTTEFT